MLGLIGLAALANSPRDALRFCQACQALRAKLVAVLALAETRRLRWLPDATHEVSDEGRALTVAERTHDAEAWVIGGALPTTGVSTWRISVDKSRRDDGNGLFLGVCDAAACCSWGVFLYSGRLRRISRDADGKLDLTVQPPDGFPNGNYKQVLKDEAGRRCSLRGRATGAVVEVRVDHDAGSLGYRVNDGPCLGALPLTDDDPGREGPRAFPKGAALRPYAACYYPGDCISFRKGYV